ncbi:GerMN domain-containing protein [Butyrivibrio proteoclasticus]|uniref:GerMN domain-containing protein n=1 Tax=Butyrivibrio proteoclasticus TaxID=43305 RepID=UPI00047975AD|nr:GerMN domain-containing protein [Butyrivibrio proteoclasticus]
MKNQKKIIRNLIVILGLTLVLGGLAACAKNKSQSANAIKVYYVNVDETGIISQDYELKAGKGNTDEAISELIEVLKTMPDRLEYEAPISSKIDLVGYSVNDNLLTLNFNAGYNDLGRTIEILDRAAIVRTFTQLDHVDYVSFQIEGTPLTDHSGSIIGNMSSDTFIYNVGNEINTYEKVELKLYFANETGDKLVPVYRSVVYNSNISMERLAIEQIISGPNNDISSPTISNSSKINSISVKDGTCYVDFDASFLENTNNVSAEVALYSIVNTVTELPNINKVVMSVNGELTFTYMDYLINGAYERNLDIME